MRFPRFVISPAWPQTVLLLWLANALMLPVGDVMGAPTTTTGRPSRGDRVPPPESIYSESFFLPREDGRARREAGELSLELSEESTEEATVATTTEDLPKDDAEVLRSARLIAREPNRPVFDNSSPGSRTGSSGMQEHDLDDGYYYYHYHDSFVEGVTTRDGLEDYPEHGAPIDLEDSDDDSDNGEIMELLNLAARKKKT